MRLDQKDAKRRFEQGAEVNLFCAFLPQALRNI
jgi:hypothetical protein